MASGSNPFGSGSAGLKQGVLLDGKYEILGLLGAGGMGEVYKALHVHLNAFRCIKVMKPGLMADDVYRQRFLREARLATQIHHPNLAVVHDFSILDDGTSYMVTEFIDGTTVRQWSALNGRFPLSLAAEVAVQVLGGLDYIHRKGLLHRDISADNVMLSYDSDDRLQTKIIDLGVAKDINTNLDTTQVGMLIGNPKYMSPEQLGELLDGEQLDGRADLYCLGVVLYEMLLGVPPFVSRTPNGYIVKHLTEAPPAFAVATPELDWPDGLETAVFRALEKDRRRRYPTARDFASALHPFLIRTTGTFTRAEVMRLQQASDDTIVQTVPNDLIHSDAPTRALDDEESFQAAFEDGRPAAFEEFLQLFPSSKYVPRVQELLAEAADFNESAGLESTQALRQFVKRWPEGRHRLEAEIRLADLKERLADEAWASALAADSYAAYHRFVSEFPAFHVDEAQHRLNERAAFDAAAGLDTLEGWSGYLARWGSDPHAAIARARHAELEELDRRAREPEEFDAAWESGTSAAWDAYLSRHPRSPRLDLARHCRQEAAEFELASRMNTSVMWRAFVKAWPEGRHRLDAELRLR